MLIVGEIKVELYEKTPLQDLMKSKQFIKSTFKVTQQSDALRLALVFKYGGFYSDMDAVIKSQHFQEYYRSNKNQCKSWFLCSSRFEKKHQPELQIVASTSSMLAEPKW